MIELKVVAPGKMMEGYFLVEYKGRQLARIVPRSQDEYQLLGRVNEAVSSAQKLYAALREEEGEG